MTAYTPSIAPRDLRHAAHGKARVNAEARPGLFSRVLAAMQAARQRQAEREIARYFATSGDKFTDETEREIERRFLSGSR